MHITIDGTQDFLWQWDIDRRIILDGVAVGTQVHFAVPWDGEDKALVVLAYQEGELVYANVPNLLLQRADIIHVYIYPDDHTEYHGQIYVMAREKPEDYVYTETEVLTYRTLDVKIGDLSGLSTDDKSSLVAAVNEALSKGGGYGAVTYTEQTLTANQQAQARANIGALGTEALPGAINDALAQAKASGEFDGTDGQDGAPGADGADGITPTIGDNGNWYLGDTDTGKPSRGDTGPAGADGKDGATGPQGPQGEKGDTGPAGPAGPAGADGQPGADGKSAYQYAVEGGYTGTEAEFAAKLAEEIPDKLPNPNALTFTGAVTGSYDGSEPVSVEIPSGGGDSGGGTVKYQKIIKAVTEEEVSEILFPLTAEQINLLNNADYWQFEMSMAVSGSTNTGTSLGKLYVQTYTTYATNTIVNGMALIPSTDVSYASPAKISAIYKLANGIGMRFVATKVSNYADANANIVASTGHVLTTEKLRISGDTKIPSGSKITLYAVGEREVV